MSARVMGTTVLQYIAARDHRVMTRVNGWRPPRWFRLWMIFSTRGGDGWLWYILGVLVLMFGGPQRWMAVLASGTAIAAGVGIFIALKRTFRRRRPCALGPHCWADLLPPDQFSFPSGHTITAFAVAGAVIWFYPVLAAPLIFCALSIAASRVILGMHFISDVLAGACIGVTLGVKFAQLFS